MLDVERNDFVPRTVDLGHLLHVHSQLETYAEVVGI